MPDVENRRYQRYKLPFAVQLSAGGATQVCEGIDLGAGGCRAVTLFPLQVGSSVRVRLTTDRTSLEPAGQATVVWTTREPPYRVGMRFSDQLGEQAVRFIHAILGPVRLTISGPDR